MDPLETRNARDNRVERLWKQLDTLNKGELDLKGFRSGLQKIDHPLKNADSFLQEVLRAVDTSGDGKIQYEEFRVFVEQTEKQLFLLFQSIDRDHNGKLDKTELRAAFKSAGLSVPSQKLDQFFTEVDTNHDGVISFDEWRNFLLFIPADPPGLKAVLTYYTSTVTLNTDGDTHLSGDTIEGLGILPLLFSVLFGSIIRLASTPQRTVTYRSTALHSSSTSTTTPFGENNVAPLIYTQEGHRGQFVKAITSIHPPLDVPRQYSTTNSATTNSEHGLIEAVDVNKRVEKVSLTCLLPDPGYFAAGAIAGAVSRTTTAPLDRLKVYLIANTDIAKNSKSADGMVTVKYIGKPLMDAMKELWRVGGMRSLFAGNGLNVIKVTPESAIKFGSYEGAKRALAYLEGHGDPNAIKPYSKFIAGGFGGMVSQFCVYPLDTLKFRMQCNMEARGLRGNALIVATAKEMYNTGGIRTAYRGLTMGLVGMFPYSAIDLGTFEFLKSHAIAYNSKTLHLPPTHPDCAPGSFTTGAIGAFSGAFGALVVYPINVLRTRLQTQGTIQHPQTYDGIIDCARITVSKEGIRGLFKGITPNLLKVIPAVSITYVVYENTKKILHLH